MITYGSTTLTSYNTITKIEVYYYQSTSPTTQTGGSWSTTKPTWVDGRYVWQKIRTTYEGKLDNGSYYSESDPVNITGQQGATGTSAYSYKLNASDSVIGKTKTGEYTIDKITFTATSKQGTGAVNPYKGVFKIETTANGTTWTTQYTSSGNESSKEYTIPEDIISIRCSLYQSGGTSTLLDIVTIPVVKDGIDAVGLRDSIPYYLASDKQTGVTRLDQGWTRFKPELTTEKRYLWVYYVSRYSEGDTQPELIEIKNDIVSFENHGDESPVENCVIDIELVQDLHGYDSPWPAGGGKNLLYVPTVRTYTANGVTWTLNQNGSITVSGTATEASTFYYIQQEVGETFNGNYYFQCFPTISNSIFNGGVRVGGTWFSVHANAKTALTGISGKIQQMWFQVRAGQTLNTTLYPMIYEASETATDWAPYSNICPITGWTGAKVVRTGKNLFDFVDGDVVNPYRIIPFPLGAKQKVYMSLIDKDTSVDMSGIAIGFVTTAFEAGGTLTTDQYRWVFLNNNIRSNHSNTSGGAETADGDNLLDGILIYPKNTQTLDKVRQRFDIQIILDSTATDYEPYKGQTYPITFPTEAGTVYGGQLNITTGELVVDRAMYVADGSESVRNVAYHSSSGLYYTIITTELRSKETNPLPISSRFKAQSGVSIGNCYITAYGYGLVAVLPDQTITTKEAATQWFADNPTQFVYELATPITYQLTPQEITMLCKENNIFADTGQTAISYYDNQTSTDPYVDYSATSAFEYSVKAYEATQPLYTNTYSELIGSANDVAGASFYFAKIHPDSYITNYKVKMKVRVIEPESYAETIDIQFGGYGSTFSSYDAYTTRTGSIGIYYINLYRATKAGIETNYKGHALGIGLRYATNPTNIDYKRTVIVDILELDGCTIEMFDTAVKYADIDGTGSTNYSGITEMAVATVGQNATNNTNTNYTQYANAVKAGVFGVKRYTLLMKDSENTWSSFINQANSTATTKTVCQGGFLLGKLLYSAGGAEYASGANTSTVYDAYPFDFRYSTNCGQTLISHQPVYLVGTIENDGLFHLDVSQWYTQTEPTYADEKVYVYVGMAYSSYQVWLSTENPAYMFYNGEFILYDKAQTLQNINSLKNSLETQIDNKVETWCQKTNPANNWTAEERPNHTGDLWYYIGESGTTYKNNTTYQYNGETNVWSAYSANPDLFDKIDGKSAIYYGTTSSVTSAEEGDYLVDSTDGSSYRWNNGAWVKVTDYKTAIDNIQIGGRNLARNTKGVIIDKTESADGSRNEYAYFDLGCALPLNNNDDICISFDLYMVVRTAKPKLAVYNSNNKGVHQTCIYTNILSGTSYQVGDIIDERITFVSTITDRESPSLPHDYLEFYSDYGTNNFFRISNLKVEKGNKATDWSPAPEDVEQEISTLRTDLQSQIDEKIQTFYQSTNPASSWTTTELKMAHDGDLWYYTGTTTSTYIKDNVYRYNGSNNTWSVYSASGELFDKVDSKSTIFYGTTSGTYTGVETGDYLVDSTDGSSYKYDGSKWVKVTDYQGAIDAIEVGGRNLLLNTDKFDLHKHSSGWVFNGNEASITTPTKSWAFIDLTYNSNMPAADVSSQPNMELLGNGDATLSIEAKCEGEINGLFYFQPAIYGNNNNRKYFLTTNPVPNCINGVTLSNEWKRYSITFPVDYTDTKYWTSDSTQLSYPNTGFGARVYWYSTGTAYFRKPKLERGNKVTDWTLAPEDIEANIQQVQNNLDNLEIGGRNLLLKSDREISNANYNIITYNLSDKGQELQEGDIVTFSMKARILSERKRWAIYNSGSSLNISDWQAITPDGNSDVIYTWTGEWKVNHNGSPVANTKLYVYLGTGSGTENNTIYWAKLEKGHKMTDWTLAPEDTDANIGGRNLLYNSATMPAVSNGDKGWRASGGTVTHVELSDPPIYNITGAIRVTNTDSTAKQIGMAQDRLKNKFIAGEEYTQSCWVRASDNLQAYMTLIWISDSQTTGNSIAALGQYYNISTDWTYIKIEGITLKGDQAASYSAGYVYALNVPTNGWIEVCGMKLEKGNRATDWTPAPEDTQADIDTALAQSVEYIIGTQTAATGNWTGVSSSLTELKDGTQIRYWLPYAGSGNASLNLTLKDGTATGAIPIYRQGGSASSAGVVTANRVTTHFPAGTSISMVYGVNRIVSAVYSGTTYTGTFTGWFADGAYDSGNTYNRTRMQNAITATTAITAGRIICGTSSGYKNIGANIAFDLSYPLLYAASAITATKTGDNNYLQINGISASNNGTITSGGANKTLYLKGTVSGNTFTISASPFMTTVVPTSADGFYYIPLGLMYSATAIYFNSSNRLYAYLDGAFQPVDTAAVLRAQDAKNLATAVYGTCSTAAGTAAKSVACNNFVLFNGARIQITFTYANTASVPTLNVNNTGAKSIYINKSVVSTSNQLLWGAGSKMEFVYDGTGWILQNAPFSLYGTCNTASATANKEVTCNEAVICKASVIYVKMTYSTTAASAKLNVASTGAKDIKANGANLTANSRFNWNAGATIAFTFDGQYWNMSDDTITAYVTDTSDDGIMVHPVNDQNTGWSIGNSIQLLKNSISYIKLWLENNIAKIRIGEENKGHIIIDNDSVDVMNNNTCLASFGVTSTIGQTDGAHIEQNSSGLQVIDTDGNNQVTFGAQSAVTTWENSTATIPPSTEENNIVQIELPTELASDQDMTLTIDTTVYTIPTMQTYSYTHTDYTISYDGTYIITITNLSTSTLNSTLDYPVTQPLNYGITATTPNATRIKARTYANNTIIAEGGIYANDAGNFGLFDSKRSSWMIMSDINGNVRIPSLTPKIISTTKVTAPATKGSWAYANIQLKQWAVIAVRVSVHNVRQYILFFSTTTGSIQNIMDSPSSTLYVRGQFMAKWDTNRIYVNWVNGNTSVYQTVFFDQVIGLIRK